MIWNSTLRVFIPHNPIILRDLLHQQRVGSLSRKFSESVGVVILALGFTVAMIFCVVYGVASQSHEIYLGPIQLLAWLFHALAALRLLAAGIFNIAWDKGLLDANDLLLTPLTNWQLLLGKWWSVMHQVRGWMLALGIVQLGVVVSTGFGLLMKVDWRMECGSPCLITIEGLYKSSWFTPTIALFVVISAFGLTILEMLCCTALGMAVGMLVRGYLGLICAIAIRFAPVFIFSFFPTYPWAYSDDLLSRYQQYTWFTFADGGTGAILQLAHPIDVVVSSFHRGVFALCAVTGMFLMYLGFSLLVMWLAMQRSRN